MNIYGITAILQELAYQSNSLTSPAARTEATAPVHDVTMAAQKVVEAEGLNLAAGQPVQVEAQQTSPQPLPVPVFLPLPLRSDIFPEARFFVRPEDEKPEAKAAEHDQIMDIFICLITETMGRVWVGLFCRKEYLSVKCFTDQESTNKLLRQNFTPLRESLKEIGFKEVSLTSQARLELGAVVEGLLPKFESHLLDHKV
ncbi:flagellar hook-length control protein FliK [Pelotomaculum propionicicum]|uniref:Flagellar hook-length control protein-like C-terminal domain-containing protein n=1 Tax=Pelotomaculum propionicicum TaxID=258475 RepID=A0A4Y7RQN7_9FIRM|nr:flagellar hook-length control protein FliK [Pelotomaculum propionicicum]NLI11814.1 flagellar hook-length control protein FliK [Peptococcaceae bacterium]TEB11324.1 hypothetical protein Pmgp_01687 [Pelotomaculum propionicicum]